MTLKQALQEAQRRWGKNAAVQENPKSSNPKCRCYVGCIMLGMFFEVRGEGGTWEEAFKDADDRVARDRERLSKAKGTNEMTVPTNKEGE